MTTSQNKPTIDGTQAIAIIGMGAKMPGALDAPTFWNNIINGVDAITDVPHDRWDPALYFSTDRDAPDKTYSKIGGWVTGFEFDRREFRMPPTVVKSTDPTQLMTLAAVKEALEDAGYHERDFDRDRTAVILGNALGGDLRDRTNLRIQYAELHQELRSALVELSIGQLDDNHIERLLDAVETKVKSSITGISEDSMPGELANVIAGRVAQTFDLRGPNFTCDAACASTLAALESAMQGLRSHQFDMCIAGGADMSMGPPSFVKFSKIGALSADGSRPFDANANGFVMGEGVGVFVLKRLSDAIESGDPIYAVIRGIGGSSDGRGKGITAPNPVGQKLAVRRAYQDAGIAPNTVGLIEAHGTSTPVGDPVEVASIKEVFSEDDTRPGRIGLGSVKSMIGHLKSAAAAASVIKVASALHNKTLPPSINVTEVNPALELDGTPFEVQRETQEWAQGDYPRRAGISAFGFGGTNFHLVMEEYSPEGGTGGIRFGDGTSNFFSSEKPVIAQASVPTEGILGFAADSLEALNSQFQAFVSDWDARGYDAALPFRLGFDANPSDLDGNVRLAIVFTDVDELDERIPKAAKGLERNKGWRVLSNQGVYFSEVAQTGDLSMLFPGQGSQYIDMLGELRERFPVVEKTIAEADSIMSPILGKPLSEIMYPAAGTDESEAFLALSQTEVTQPAVLTADIALFRLLEELGIEPDMVAGHSLGEYGACVAAGVMNFPDALRTVAARGTEMSKATPMNGDCGLMAGVPASVEEVQPVLDAIDGYVVCANKNCPGQTIIAGLTEAVEEAVAKFEEMGMTVVLLPVSHAFHSKVVAAASEPLRRHLDTIGIHAPSTPILTNVTGDFYPEGTNAETEIRDLLSKQVAAPVEYIALVERMYERGARVFVEVGPKRAQTSFVGSILEGRDHTALYTNHPKKGDVATLFDALAELWTVSVWQPTNAVATVDAAPRKAARMDSNTTSVATSSSLDRSAVLDVMVEVLCAKTGYDPEEIETDFELEADLGVDTVKQAEIMAEVRERYGLPKDEDFRLAEYPTLDRLADYVLEKAPATESHRETSTAREETAVEQPAATPQRVATTEGPSRSAVLDVMVEVLCAKTGYDSEEIEVDFELEADLGVDTVKQAEIMAEVRERYGLPKDEDFRLAEYPTLARLADYVLEKAPATEAPSEMSSAPAPTGDEQPVTTSAAPPANTEKPSRSAVLDVMVEVLCAKTGYDPDEIEVEFELEADLGVDTVKQAEIMAEVRERYGLPKDEDFRLAEYPTLARLADYVLEKAPSTASQVPSNETPGEAQQPSSNAKPETSDETTAKRIESNPNWTYQPTFHDIEADAVISGSALGLPGLGEVFSEQAVDALLSGTNMIGDLSEDLKKAMVAKNIVRLVKHKSGGGEMVPVTETGEVIKLGGQMGDFDISEFGIDERLEAALDETSQLAIAAGLLALRDAGLPLVPRYRETTTGKKVTTGWTLPESVGKTTGVIFASAFAGQDALIDEVKASFEDDYQFNHRFLLRILGIANSRFAEYVGARGPNTKINNACASTTTAISMARDWIRLGHCERVVVLSADNASGKQLMEWISSGFLATGAASTEANVEDAALPFDKRRDGMIIGMGAAALIVEAAGLPEARGIEPIADILETRYVNSALHPTRLDVDHIADEVSELVGRAESRFELERGDIAGKTVFVSHETYTPRRGGSAAAEIESLRRTFGDSANQVVVANTKGFTGHAMAAGIEDVLALKALQRRAIPHIANFRDPDPDLGDLRLSQGGEYQVDYALRLAAGFGSQLALALFRFRARTEDRVFDPELNRQWLAAVSGFQNPNLEVVNRTLRMKDGAPVQPSPTPTRDKKAPSPAPSPASSHVAAATNSAPASATASAQADANPADFAPKGVVVEAQTRTSYDRDALRAALGGKRVALVGGPLIVAQFVQNALMRCKADIVVVREHDDRSPFDEDALVVDLDDQAATTAALRDAKFDGIVNLLGFGHEGWDVRDVCDAARRSFHLARGWQDALGQAPGEGNLFVSVTGMGGRLGFDRAAGPLPVSGAVTGFTKALAREWEDAAVRVVDITREGLYPDLGMQILAQALDPTAPIEVGIIGGVRYVPAFVDLEDIMQEGDDFAPSASDVLVVTGGAKGITAEIALDLAERFGCKLALVGRTEITYDNPLAVDLDEEQARLKAELAKSNDRVTPVMVRRAMWPLESQRTIAENMKRMTSAGSEVAYFSCDVADEGSVSSMLEAVRETFGRIDGVIHGAGVEESKLLADKDDAGFDRVFLGKAAGALHLWRNAPVDLKYFVAFGSVAGRFGNPGQVDYSAANEVLNKLVATINSTTATRALSIDWTAWDEVGMASDGAMRMLLEHRGVQLLPPHIGAPMVGNFLESGIAGEVLVAGALGDFDADEAVPSSDLEAPVTTGQPLVDRVIERSDKRVVIERTFRVDHDQFLADHVYEGNAVVPGVMGFEMMAEAASLLGVSNTVFEQVGFDRAIKLHHGEPVRLTATAERTTKGAAIVVESHRTSKTGRELQKQHFLAEVRDEAPAAASPKELDELGPWLEGPQRAELYRYYFHTGVFQVVDEIAYVGENAVIGHGRVPTERFTRRHTNDTFVTDPMVREMAFQVAGFWGMSRNQMSYLPLGIERAEQFGVARPGSRVTLRCVVRDDAREHAIAFDIDALGEDGELLQRLHKVELIGHRKLTEDERPAELSEAHTAFVRMSGPEAEAYLADRGLKLDSLLFTGEREALDRLLSDRRRGEWVAARVASKVLVQRYLADFHGIAVALPDVEIAKDPNGAPHVRLHGDYPVVEVPHLTITHSSGLAIAALAGPGPRARLGIDLERIEVRDEAFAKNYFRTDELDLRSGLTNGSSLDRPTFVSMLWAIKEAVSKALGLGLKLRLDDVQIAEVEHTDGWRARIVLHGEAAARLQQLGGEAIEVSIELQGHFVLARARFLTDIDATEQVDIVVPQPRPKSKGPTQPLHIAAVAAFLKHKGLAPVIEPKARTDVRPADLPTWKS